MLALLLGWGCATPAPPLLVLAPGSTEVPVARLVRDWAASQRTSATVVFDDSAALARMVDGGTPADLLLLSDPVRMDGLEDRQHLDATTRTPLAGDDLAVVASIVATRPPRDLRGLMAQTGTVWLPAEGSAEAEAVERLTAESGAWDVLAARVQYAHDEDALLEALQSDPLATGLLSAGRAVLGVNVAVSFALSPAEPPLLIEAAVVAHADRPETAAGLLEFLGSPEAEAPFRARGFRGLHGPGPGHGHGAPPPDKSPHPHGPPQGAKRPQPGGHPPGGGMSGAPPPGPQPAGRPHPDAAAPRSPGPAHGPPRSDTPQDAEK